MEKRWELESGKWKSGAPRIGSKKSEAGSRKLNRHVEAISWNPKCGKQGSEIRQLGVGSQLEGSRKLEAGGLGSQSWTPEVWQTVPGIFELEAGILKLGSEN